MLLMCIQTRGLPQMTTLSLGNNHLGGALPEGWNNMPLVRPMLLRSLLIAMTSSELGSMPQSDGKTVSPMLTFTYRSEFKCRRHLTIVAIVITVGNNNPALCICGNDGGNNGIAKIINYFCDDIYIRNGSLYSSACILHAWLPPVGRTVLVNMVQAICV